MLQSLQIVSLIFKMEARDPPVSLCQALLDQAGRLGDAVLRVLWYCSKLAEQDVRTLSECSRRHQHERARLLGLTEINKHRSERAHTFFVHSVGQLSEIGSIRQSQSMQSTDRRS